VEARRASTDEENRSGQNGSRSGVGQPLVRGQSGVGQGGKNGDSSSENSESEEKTAENSRPEGRADTAA
jgi:hypothetical protein